VPERATAPSKKAPNSRPLRGLCGMSDFIGSAFFTCTRVRVAGLVESLLCHTPVGGPIRAVMGESSRARRDGTSRARCPGTGRGAERGPTPPGPKARLSPGRAHPGRAGRLDAEISRLKAIVSPGP
jgi:hypothetical protein